MVTTFTPPLADEPVASTDAIPTPSFPAAPEDPPCAAEEPPEYATDVLYRLLGNAGRDVTVVV